MTMDVMTDQEEPLLPTIEAEMLQTVDINPPKRGDWYGILACWRGSWSIDRRWYTDKDMARRESARKVECGFRFVQMIRLKGNK